MSGFITRWLRLALGRNAERTHRDECEERTIVLNRPVYTDAIRATAIVLTNRYNSKLTTRSVTVPPEKHLSRTWKHKKNRKN